MATKVETWREQLEAWRTSGQSMAAFCRERGLAYARFMYWQRRLGRTAGLLPIQVQAPAAAGLALELTLPGNKSLRVRGASVADVVALVRGLSC